MSAPSSSRDWPVEIRRYLTHRALQRLLESQGGWQELALWLYAGETRPDGERVPYAPSIDGVWPFILADAQAWQTARAAATAGTGQ